MIDTHYNTVLDSLMLAKQAQPAIQGINALPLEFFVASIHRNELLAQPREVKQLLEHIAEEAKVTPCIVLDLPITRERIKQLGYDALLDSSGITRGAATPRWRSGQSVCGKGMRQLAKNRSNGSC